MVTKYNYHSFKHSAEIHAKILKILIAEFSERFCAYLIPCIN